MLRPGLVILTLLFAIAAPEAGWSLPKNLGGADQCYCACDTASGGEVSLYDSRGLSCMAFDGATCNRENKATGLIESGKLSGCSTRFTWEMRTQGAVGKLGKSKLKIAPQ
jgi:hypothetical protein